MASQPIVPPAASRRNDLALLKIDAKLAEIQDKDFAKAAAGDLDAVLVFEQELPRLKSLGITPASYRLLAIPAAAARPSLPAGQTWQSRGRGLEPGRRSGDRSSHNASRRVRLEFQQRPLSRRSKLHRQILCAAAAAAGARSQIGVEQNRRQEGLAGLAALWSAEAPAAGAAPPRAPADDVPPALSEAPAATGSLRLLAAARPPLTNPQAKDGGVVLSVLTGAFGSAGIPVTVQWTDNQRAMLDGLAGGKTADAGLFWQQTNCDAPHDQSASEAVLCDRAVLSEPLMQAVLAVFIRLDAALSATGQEGPQKRTICIPESQSVPDGALSSIPWAKAAQVKLLRPKTLIDCLAAVDGREADALIQSNRRHGSPSKG